MLKKFLTFSICCVFSLSLCLPVLAQTVPSDVENAIKQDLEKSEKKISKLINMDTNKKSIQADNLNPSLEASYPIYFLTVDSDTYNSDIDNNLEFNGYLFEVAAEDGSNIGVAFTDKSVNYSEIVQMSTDTNFSSQMAEAKTLVGYNENSRLIYDLAYRVVALVTPQEDSVKVALLRDSKHNSLNQYAVYDFEDFINMIKIAEEKRIQEATQFDTNEPLSGGSVGTTSNDSSPSYTNAFLVGSVTVALVGIIAFLLFRNSKKHT
ncbi:hypothetical protein D3C74_88790 [compost metagenome]